MAVRADVEEIQPTRTERLLAVVLAAFLLLGAIWTYQKVDDVIRAHMPLPRAEFIPGPATRKYDAAQERVYRAQAAASRALQQLELKREAYRTALEAHRPAKQLGKQYDTAQATYAHAQQSVRQARAQAQALAPAARAEEQRGSQSVESVLHRQDRDIFLARLGMVAFAIVLAFGMLAWLRRRPTRWYPLTGSVVAAATIFTFVLASDYITDYFNPFGWGIALIALLGIVATLLAYWGLQRYITRRLPLRRVRKHQCPFCGYPAGAGTHCEGCGREIVAACARCESPRRVGTAHCAVCGAT